MKIARRQRRSGAADLQKKNSGARISGDEKVALSCLLGMSTLRMGTQLSQAQRDINTLDLELSSSKQLPEKTHNNEQLQ